MYSSSPAADQPRESAYDLFARGTRFLRGLLFEVEPIDPVIIGGAAVLLMAAAALAAYAPMRRAARADVVSVLRSQ